MRRLRAEQRIIDRAGHQVVLAAIQLIDSRDYAAAFPSDLHAGDQIDQYDDQLTAAVRVYVKALDMRGVNKP
jgi:hypothetical protein